jgi:hypothetical protein
MTAAPTSGLWRRCRCQIPSASVHSRGERRSWMRRRRASTSAPTAAALTRAHSARSSASDSCPAWAPSVASAAGWARAASAMAAVCAPDSRPPRAAASRAGRPSRRRAVAMASAASVTVVAAALATWAAAERSPVPFQARVAASRAPALARMTPAMRSMAVAAPRADCAWAADNTAASKPTA